MKVAAAEAARAAVVLEASSRRVIAASDHPRDAEIVPAVLGGRGEAPDLGRAARTITPGQRTAPHLRDKGCTHPGCSMPPAWCTDGTPIGTTPRTPAVV